MTTDTEQTDGPRAAARNRPMSAIVPLLQHRLLRVLLIAAPGLTAAVAILTATESSLLMTVILNAATGIIISSVLFIAIGLVAGRHADERVGLAQAAGNGFWQARSQRLSIYDETGLYSDWYFRMRLQEEIERSQRHELGFSVLVIRQEGLHPDNELPAANSWFGDHVRRHLRRSDLMALMQNGSLAVLLGMTGKRAANAVLKRVAAEMTQVDAKVGIASFPEDGDSPTTLLAAAVENATAQKRAA